MTASPPPGYQQPPPPPGYQQPPPPPPGYYGPPGRPAERPFGVTLLAVLYIIGGLMALAVPFTMSAMLSSLGDITGGATDGVGMLCWVVFLLIAAFYIITAFGLLKGASWARTVALILAVLGLLNIPIGTIISIILIIYLRKPEVKAWFQ